MKYKVTALENVTIRAYVRSTTTVRLGGVLAQKPTEREEWVSLCKGEVRDDLGLILGVHPHSIPGGSVTHVGGIPMVFPDEGWSNSDLPKEFFGLFRLELSEGETPSGGGVHLR